MKQFDLFENYLSGNLNATEVSDFETRLKSNEDFKADFELHKTLQNSFDILVEDDVKKVIADIDNKPQATHVKKVRMNSSRKWLAVAASLFFFAAAYYFVSSNTNPQTQMAELFESFDSESITRGGDQKKVDETKVLINDLAKKQDWTKVVHELNTLLSQSKGNIKDQIEFNLAVAYGFVDKAKSKELANKILDDPDHLYQQYDEKIKQLLRLLEKS